MTRPTTNADEITSAQPSLRDGLRALIEQQGELGQRILFLAMRAETETEDLKAQVKACAAELGEARADLAELRAAHEIELKKRATAEARLVKLQAKIAKFQDDCTSLDEDDDAKPVMAARAETDAEPAPGTDPVVGSLGLTETELASVDLLIFRGEAPDRKTMLGILVRSALAEKGLPTDAAAQNRPARGEEVLAIPC